MLSGTSLSRTVNSVAVFSRRENHMCRTICSTIIRTVAKMPTVYIPAPIAIPMPEVVQIPAAVVSPLTDAFRIKIMPAPKKLTPVMTFAAILEASALNPPYCKISKKPYFDTIIISAEPSATMICVRMPASFCRRLRSRPIHAPHRHAASIRTII